MAKKVKVNVEELYNLFHDFKKYNSLTMKIGKKLMDEFNLMLSHIETNGGNKCSKLKKK